MVVRTVRSNKRAVLAQILAASIDLMDRAGDLAEGVADARVPVLSGALKASKKRTGRGTKKQTISYGGGKVDYPAYVEFGTSQQAAQPFLRPGAEAAKAVIRAAGAKEKSVG